MNPQIFETEQKAYIDFNVHFLERVMAILSQNISRIMELTVKEISSFQRHVGQIKRQWNSRISIAGKEPQSILLPPLSPQSLPPKYVVYPANRQSTTRVDADIL
jgi:hypothetical protein